MLFHFEKLALGFGGAGLAFILAVHSRIMGYLPLNGLQVRFLLIMTGSMCAGMMLAVLITSLYQWWKHKKTLFFLCVSLAAAFALFASYGLIGLAVFHGELDNEVFLKYQRLWMTGLFVAIAIGTLLYCLRERDKQKELLPG
jgi:hypothetical protein